MILQPVFAKNAKAGFYFSQEALKLEKVQKICYNKNILTN